MAAGVPATPDVSQGLKPADVMSFGRVAETKTSLNPANLLWAEKLSKMRETQTAADLFKNIAEDDNRQQYNLASGQQDAARFGGGAGRLDANGKAELKVAKTPDAQKERFERGRKALENTSKIMFWMDMQGMTPAQKAAEVTRLNAENPAFKALGFADRDANGLEAAALTVLGADSAIQDILSTVPGLTQAQKDSVIKKVILGDPDYRDNLRLSVQKLHDRILQLPQAQAGEAVQLQTDKATADTNVSTRAFQIADRAKKDPTLSGKGLNEARIKKMIESSGSTKDFTRELALQLGVTPTEMGNVMEYATLQTQIKAFDAQLAGVLGAPQRKAVDAQRTAAVARAGVLTGAYAGATDMDTELKILQKAQDFAGSLDIAPLVAEGINSSIESRRIAKDISASKQVVEVSTDMDARLTQEDQIIRELEKITGKAYAQTLVDREETMQALREEYIVKEVAKAGTEGEKALIRGIEVNFVAYDRKSRATTIKGDNIMEASRLLTFGDRGLKLLMARDMGLLPRSQVTSILEQDGPELQQKKIDALLAKLEPANSKVVDDMMIKHGSTYRQQVFYGYHTMQDYFKEGFLGHAIRLGRKVQYEGDGSRLKQYVKGELGLNVDELALLHAYCENDFAEGLSRNSEAKSFIQSMKEQGLVADWGKLKYLLIFLMMLVGGGAMAGPALLAGGGAAALGGSGVGMATTAAGIGVGAGAGGLAGRRATIT